MQGITILLKDSRFWAAVLALANAVLFYFLPDFPAEIWAAFNALVSVVLVVLASNTARTTSRAMTRQRHMEG